MLFGESDTKRYIEKLDSYLLSLPALEMTEYISTLVNQLIEFFAAKGELSSFDLGEDYFGIARDGIRKVMEGPLNVKSIELAHFEAAKLYRLLGYGGFHNFNETPIVRFYLWPHFENIDYKKIDIIRFDVPIQIILKPQREGLDKILDEIKKLDVWQGKVDEWSSQAESAFMLWEDRVREGEARFKNITSGINYLGLAHAFEEMLNEKKDELRKARHAMFFCGLSSLIIPLAYLLVGNSSKLSDFMMGVFYFESISVLSFSVVFEALILYYFRIIYGQWSAVKHQILQLRLRHQMCAFANEYSRSSQDMDRSSLSKFENLVFSELSVDASVPPSLYDAADAIAKVISGFRKPEGKS